MRRLALPLALALALSAGGCERRPDDVAVVVSAIGGDAAIVNPATNPPNFPSRVLLGATAQGLVRFDSAGGIEPGLAERWIVIDGGRSYIFRLHDAQWADGRPVTAGDAVASIRRTIASNSRISLAPFLAVIDEVVEMTPQIIEIRLKQPRPDLLKLFAHPELAIIRRDRTGTGPFRVIAQTGPERLLRRIAEPVAPGEDPTESDPADDIRLRSERAASAILRFARRESDLVLGGSFNDLPVLAAAEVAPANVRIDPAAGLFGFAVVARQGFLASRENRAAVAMAIDRAALTSAFRPDWQPVETLLPARLDSGAPPAAPQWAALPMEQRRATARERVSAWRADHPDGSLSIRIATGDSPGATLVWARVAHDLRDIGLQPHRVGDGEDADLRLIDAVAPYDSGRWYLVNACQACPGDLVTAIQAARDAPTLAERARHIAMADMALATDTAYIPVAQPLRWSLVALRLRAWQPNSRAWHSLTHLRAPDQ